MTKKNNMLSKIHTYNKLIRDNLKEKILSDCLSATFSYVVGEEKQKALQKKLIEEAKEFLESGDIKELADVFEVIDSIIKEFNFDIDEVKRIQKDKREERGGFDEGLFLKQIVKYDKEEMY